MLANQATVRVVRPVAGNGPNSDVAKNKTSNINVSQKVILGDTGVWGVEQKITGDVDSVLVGLNTL